MPTAGIGIYRFSTNFPRRRIPVAIPSAHHPGQPRLRQQWRRRRPGHPKPGCRLHRFLPDDGHRRWRHFPQSGRRFPLAARRYGLCSAGRLRLRHRPQQQQPRPGRGLQFRRPILEWFVALHRPSLFLESRLGEKPPGLRDLPRQRGLRRLQQNRRRRRHLQRRGLLGELLGRRRRIVEIHRRRQYLESNPILLRRRHRQGQPCERQCLRGHLQRLLPQHQRRIQLLPGGHRPRSGPGCHRDQPQQRLSQRTQRRLRLH